MDSQVDRARTTWMQRVMRAGVVVMLVSFFIGSLFLATINAHLPDVTALKDMHMQVPLRVYSRDDKLIAQYGTKRRIPVSLSQIPPLQVKAVLAVEDARYYEHPGVDFIGLLRAAKAVILTGRKVQGASTITMQVARNFFLTRKKTYMRKIREIMLALKIDRVLSKNKVLELYLNKVYFGNRSYGVAAAGQAYYGKKLNQLTLAQMAMIAGLPQAPSRNNPIVNPSSAMERRNHVLDRMLEVGYISKAQHDRAVQAPVTASYHRQKIAFHAPYVAELVRQLMVADFGRSAYDSGYQVVTTIDSRSQMSAQRSLENGLIDYSMRHGYRGPIKNLGDFDQAKKGAWQQVLSSLSGRNQLTVAAVMALKPQSATVLLASGEKVVLGWDGLQWARRALKYGLVGPQPKLASDFLHQGDVIYVRQLAAGRWQLCQTPVVQGALVSMEPANGSIRALVGGYDYSLSNFNRVTQALRQPGSSFKPFIYSAALAKGFTLASIINDAPIVMKDSGENQLWRPNNDTLKFYGPTRLRVGLAESRNLVSIRLLQDISIPYAIEYISRFGFKQGSMPKSLSLALGSMSVRPLDLVAGYAVFANGGYRVQPHFIQSITNAAQKVIYTARFPLACTACINGSLVGTGASDAQQQRYAPKVITPQNAFVMTQALKGVIQNGTGRAAKVLGRDDLAGKTGTTNKQADAWFAGYNGQVATVVWVGFDNLKSLHEYGSKAALPIWIDYMRQTLKGMAYSSMPTPGGIVTVRIDPHNGLLARPDQGDSIFEVFRQQDAPTQFSQLGEDKSSVFGPAANNDMHANDASTAVNSPLF